jgi:hypothetical protein
MNNKIQGITKEILYKLYFEELKSFSQIANIFDTQSQTICNRFKEYGLRARNYSESLKGRTIFWKDKIRTASKGKTHAAESKRKISLSKIGCIPYNKGLTKFQNPDKVKYGCPNDKHWNWKGGISDINCRIRQSSEYKLWRTQCFQRDGYTCRECKKIGGTLNVHHEIQFSELIRQKKPLFDLKNGKTLCKSCHKKLHWKIKLEGT